MEPYNLINAQFINLSNQVFPITSLTIVDGKIDAINAINHKFKTIDLNGDVVIPGFIDAHFHLKNFGKRLSQLNLKNIKDLQIIKTMIVDKLKTINHGEWLIGYGWDQNLWNEQAFPNKDILNEISPNNPIYLTRVDGHSAWINQCALKKINKDEREIQSVKGGDFINQCILIDNAMNVFKKHLPSESIYDIKKWIKLAIKKTAEMGITGVHDAWQDRKTIQAIKELIDNNEFPIRCYGMLAGNDTELLNEYFESGHLNSPYLNIRSVKAFIDGALGSRGAALKEAYCDDENNCGLILISKEEFSNLIKQCYKHNFQLNTHAIGDRGNQYVLNLYKNVLQKSNNRRWRIEHAQMVDDDDINMFKDHSILPSMQPSHCTSDMKWLKQRIGENRLKLISRWNSFLKLDIPIPGGSDCPIEIGNPLFEFYAAVTRQDHQGFPKGGWQPQEKINHVQALKMFTTWAAYGGFQEDRRGKLDIGFDADFTVLSDNILDMQDLQILDLKIKKTIVNGRFVYEQ